MMGKTPPMGWNSWNTFGWEITDSLIREVADSFIDNGLAKAGYEYIVIDDCWSEKQRDKNGLLVPDANKFPNGIKAVSDYVHSKGLKFGMYSCAGTQTCAGHPGSFEHEFIDAESFAQWGVDYLKYDYCYKPSAVEGKVLYKRMAMALRNSGRDILFSACNWGNDDALNWMRATGAHIYRSTGDIQDNWESIKKLALQQVNKECYSGPYCYNDVDMLVVGMYGKGNVALGGCSDEEYKTHFSLWSLMNSPLMIGCDIRKMNDATKEILTNTEIIDINQDIEGRQAYSLNCWNNEDCKAFIKPMHDGGYAIGFFNLSDETGEMALPFYDIGLPTVSGFGLSIRDVWKHEELGIFKESYTRRLQAHSCEVFRAKVVKL